jgi:hypothetical protein
MSAADNIKRRLRRRLTVVALVYLVTFGPCLVVGVIVGVGRMIGVFGPGPAPPPPDRPIVARLKVADFNQQEAALKELQTMPPDRQQRDIVQAILGVLRFGTPQLKIEALKALARWGQSEDAAAVVPLLEGRWPGMAPEAVKTLGQLKGPVAAAALAGELGKGQHEAAAEALRTFGNEAEKPLLARITSEDVRVRQAVCELLGKVGTADSLPTLRQAAEDDDPSVREAAKASLEALEK